MPDTNRGYILVAAIAVLFVTGITGSKELSCQRDYYARGTYRGGSEEQQPPHVERGWLPCLVERATASPKVQGASEKEQRDLIAQEGMALWAFWMVVFAGATTIITAIGTIFIAKQVKLTRAAVEDTSNATAAMERQNELTALAQRAWVTFDVYVRKLEVRGNGIAIAIEAIAKNIGKSVARDFEMCATVGRHADIDEIMRNSRERRNGPYGTSAPLVPGDTKEHWCVTGYPMGELSPNDQTGRYEFDVFVTARYRIAGDDEFKFAERAYSVCEGTEINPFAARGLKHPIPPLISAQDVYLMSAGRIVAT